VLLSPRGRLAPIAFGLPLVLACSRTQGAAPAAAARGLSVRVAPAAVQEVVYRISALGSLEAEELVQVTTEVEGAVTAVKFHEGDRVNEKTVLLRIDPERYRLEAERAEATYKKAVADRDRAVAERKRREELASQELVAQEELNRARGENDRLAAEADAAKAARDIALQNRDRSLVRPPRAGVINTRNVDTGQFVKTGNILATLVDVSRLRLRFKVSEGESLQARVGQDVDFHVAALGDRSFTGRIYHVGDVAEPTTRQVEVLAWVANPGVLKPGFFAEVALAAEARKDAVVIPEAAVQASERGFVTYVVEGGKARLRPIQTGLRTGNGIVEILSGLKPGETVVVEGSDRLADGIAVQAKESSEPGGGASDGRAGAPAASSSPTASTASSPGAGGQR
jgi:RND family efflux transporter MFP subunit